MSREVVSWEAIVRGEEEEAAAVVVVVLLAGSMEFVLLGWVLVRAVGRGVDEEAVVRVVGGGWSGALEGGAVGRRGGVCWAGRVIAGGIRIAGKHLRSGV